MLDVSTFIHPARRFDHTIRMQVAEEVDRIKRLLAVERVEKERRDKDLDVRNYFMPCSSRSVLLLLLLLAPCLWGFADVSFISVCLPACLPPCLPSSVPILFRT